MARIRYNKQRRGIRIAQKAVLDDAVTRHVLSNLASGKPETTRGNTVVSVIDSKGRQRVVHMGYRSTPDYNQAYTFHGATNLPRLDNLGKDGTKYGVK